jgi:ribosomal protein L19E
MNVGKDKVWLDPTKLKVIAKARSRASASFLTLGNA